ncbi:site-specific DNA-methyltransferase [Roseomonas sp. E05]|uniref:site-specific DNA-methyltransferase n=1 Tax=Roseomonas sp. E05 TaxID=3046310 RepID=UPI0024B9CE41|nr:site-specific DNA-methyltransferase [Roseomonas sp. E05]MDJ0391069.1 site-specific DNA-methyltransferase [Roseomonas sp. E05]
MQTCEWPADQVQRWPLARLTPYARNARTHSDAQVAQIAASIREWGWTVPVLVDEAGTIIAGHGRVLAAQRLALTEVPVMVARGWSEAKRRAYVLADNKLALNAGWDEAMLRAELADLAGMGADLSLTGFSAEEVAALTAEGAAGLTDPDEVPEVPAAPASRLGDVWQLGRHRLVCGDSTSTDDVAKALNGVAPHLMVTDPPYGVAYDPSWRNQAGLSGTRRTGKVLNDDRADWRAAWALFPGAVAYVWHGALHATTVAESLTAEGFQIRAQVIWAKDRLVMSRGHYHWQHEPCWYAVREGTKGHWSGDRKQTTLWSIPSRDQDATTVHGTQKPVECMRRPIENNSSPGQAVYEPFSGSGTTLIAAEMSGRACHALELDPAYVDVAVLRWQAFSGQVAVLEGDGRGFAEIASTRGPEAVEAA